MALRILWDEYESALLLSELLRVLNGEISRKDAVKNVSEALRKRATAQGVEIDDIFRNENGIQLQMRAMEYIFTDGTSGLEKPSAMFRQTVGLYRTDREKIYKILQGEGPMATKKRTLEEPFIAWLSTRVSSKELSDCYLRFTELEPLLRKSGDIEQTFFELTDIEVIDRIYAMLADNKPLLRSRKIDFKQMNTALSYYVQFLKTHEVEVQAVNNAKGTALPGISQEAELPPTVDLKTAAKKMIPEKVEFTLEMIPNLEKLEPYAFSYFGEEHTDLSDWKQMYFGIICCLFEDYPQVFQGYVNKRVGTGGIGADFSDFMGSYRMMASKKIAPNLYVEMGLTPELLLRKLSRYLYDCAVDYENLVIECTKAPDEPVETPEVSLEEQIRAARKQFTSWLQGQQVAVGTAMAYASSITQCTKAANDKGVTTENLFLIENAEQLKAVANKLLQMQAFKSENKLRYMQYSVALKKLVTFRMALTNPVVTPKTNADANLASEPILEKMPAVPTSVQEKTIPHSLPVSVPETTFDVQPRAKWSNHAQILEKYFSENGYQPGRAIARARFRKFYLEEYGTELPGSDEQMEEVLRKVGVMRDERIYPKQDEAQNELVDRILADIQGAFQEGASAVYVRAVYEKYKQPLEEMHIYQADALTPVLLENKKIKLYLQYNSYFTNQYGIGDTEKDLERVMKEFHVPQTYSQIHEKLWYVPFDKMKSLLASKKSMVRMSQGTYFYAPNFPISLQERSALAIAIQEELHYRSFITGVELLNLIREKFPGIAVNAEAFPDAGIRDCLGYLLRDQFAFRGAIISALGTELQMGDVFAEFARSHETLPVDDLKSFAEEMNTPIYWDAVLEEMIRVSEDLLVRKERIVFDVPKIDAILEGLCPRQYMPLKEIQLFLQFPNIGYPWNAFVLESYLFTASRKFRLLHNCFGATAACGVIVRANASFADYEEVLTDALSRSNALGSTKAALQYLVDAGFQQRRSYAGIERVLQTAKLQKEQREKEEK